MIKTLSYASQSLWHQLFYSPISYDGDALFLLQVSYPTFAEKETKTKRD